jgi:hypothetical protein
VQLHALRLARNLEDGHAERVEVFAQQPGDGLIEIGTIPVCEGVCDPFDQPRSDHAHPDQRCRRPFGAPWQISIALSRVSSPRR